MSRGHQESNSAHSAAVQAITDARQHVRKYHFELERANVSDDQIFVGTNDPNHPQKNAHAAIMDYHAEINQPEYILLVDDTWPDPLTDATGTDIEVTVPKNDVVTKTVDEETVTNMIPDLSDVETKQETVSLENLAYKWAGRSITVEATIDSPYRDDEFQTETVRMWLPPKLIKAVYSKLNDVLSRIGLLAKTRPPVEHDPPVLE